MRSTSRGWRRFGVGLSLSLAAILVMTVVAPVSAATVGASWRAQIGSDGANGTATIQAYTSGSGSLALALAAFWTARRVSGGAAVLLAAAFAVSSPWMHFIHLGKTYAFTGLVAMLASWVWLEQPAGRGKGQWVLTV